MIILTENLPREPDIRINNYKLKLHSYIKYLGILIDDVLFWNEQVVSICIRPAKANEILSKLHHYLPKYICISIYYSLFYTCLVWFVIIVVWFGHFLEKAKLIVKWNYKKGAFGLLIFLTVIPTLIFCFMNQNCWKYTIFFHWVNLFLCSIL